MTKTLQQATVFILLILFCSCANIRGFFSPAFNKKSANGSSSLIRGKQLDTSGTFFMSFYDATKRSSTAFITPQGQLRVLAENNPDAAANRAFDLISSLNLTNSKDSLIASNKLSLAKTIAQLTEKSPTDILVRDALYRLNEMYLNTLCLICGNKSVSETKCDTCSQALTRINYVNLFTQVMTTAQVISASDATEAEAKLKQMQVTDSISKLNSNIKLLTDSISKLNKPAKADTTKKDTTKSNKSIGLINIKTKNLNDLLASKLQER